MTKLNEISFHESSQAANRETGAGQSISLMIIVPDAYSQQYSLLNHHHPAVFNCFNYISITTCSLRSLLLMAFF